MGIQFDVLGSSSAGNAGLLRTDRGNYLVDAGFSGRKLSARLAPFHLKLEDIKGVFITHEHRDHIAGLNVLSKIPSVSFFLNAPTAEALGMRCPPFPCTIFETGKSFVVDGLHVDPFSLPHDAEDPVGFLFRSPSRKSTALDSVAWVTDLGHVPSHLGAIVKEAQWLLLEANHDPVLLQNHPRRPWSLKQRILGPLGHLSNESTHQFLETARGARWERIILAHLSPECNSVHRVRSLFTPLERRGFSIEIAAA
jgi:phosphoribosyl 1,2-cyclic phosphodiesterase